MKLIHYKSSPFVSLGIELEIQIINPKTFDLISKAKELIRHIRLSPYQKQIKPEVTQSMIEYNSLVHKNAKDLMAELITLHRFLLNEAETLNIRFAGGGSHPFQKWSLSKIFPTKRFKNLARQYRYLSKRATVFGQHIHVGCQSGEEALYLTHALTRYVPHLIALSASSPFYEGLDTGYHSCRSHLFNVFPMSGLIPYLTDWQSFSKYFFKMRSLGVIQSMKDFYWDIRPKPEFGTVEIRVCDTPLTFTKAAALAAYAQSLAHYLIANRPFPITKDLYYLYTYNRFQACRYGFAGQIIDPVSLHTIDIATDINNTINQIENYANQLDNMSFINALRRDVLNNKDDAAQLRQILKNVGSFAKMVNKECEIWERNEDF